MVQKEKERWEKNIIILIVCARVLFPGAFGKRAGITLRYARRSSAPREQEHRNTARKND